MEIDKIKYLKERTVDTIRNEGVGSLLNKTQNYLKFNVMKQKKQAYKDILFINGCTLPHPKRYRVDHQIEQLEAYGYSADFVDYTALSLELMKFYRGFVFFRCPITDVVEEFIQLAKANNKTVFYDIDDLVIDQKYTSTIKHLKTLSEDELNLYNDGVDRMGKTLSLCDYAITTTERLAEELNHYVKEVHINRNTASDRMVELSLKAMNSTIKDSNQIVMGYLSGSITHNADFNMILPVIKKLMEAHENLYLKVVGLLDIPDELKAFKDRILSAPFVAWQSLPEIISSLDINLAPIEDSLFNEAKSENKWVEAGLCKVPTVASNLGAFKIMCKDFETALLCSNQDDWFEKLNLLIQDSKLREKLGTNAYNFIIDNCVTMYSGKGLADFIESKLSKNISFILPTTNISGGVNVILKHCSILRENGYDVNVINEDKSSENIVNADGIVYVMSHQEIEIMARIDTMVASLWSTLQFSLEYPKVKNIKYFVQNFETDFMPFGQYARILANATYSTYKNIEYITISEWCKDWLLNKYDKESSYAPNGINLNQFAYKEREFNGKIKILVEGNSIDHYKNVDESFKIIDKLDKNKYEIHFLSYQGEPKKWYYVDKFMHKVPYDQVGKVYQDADILLKSSLLESFSYPPLEMMATGGLVVAVANGGNVEYLKDNYNCLFYEQGNIEDAVEKIEKLGANQNLRERLLKNGITTAELREWKKIENRIMNLYFKGE